MKFFLLTGYLIFFCGVKSSKAQLCNGNLGSPVVNVTFGTRQAVLSGDETSFDYAPGCPSKGQYTTSNLILGCGNRTWFLIAGDHTGDQNGQFMLVNAESTPGIIHADTAKGLCGNTSYQFAAWISNVMQNFSCGGTAVLANIDFTVKTLQGVVLATYNTGNIPIGSDRIWKQYGLSFITPANVGDLLLTVETNPVYGCGSAFAIDDITFNPCGPAVTATIDGDPGPLNVCANYNNPFILKAGYDTGFNDPAVQWQSSQDTGRSWTDIGGANIVTYAIPKRTEGVVLYRMAVAEKQHIGSLNCRVNSNAIYTSVNPLPPHHEPSNFIGCLGKELFLPEADPTALEVGWTGPNGYTSTLPKSIIAGLKEADTGLYQLAQRFYFGCASLDSFYLKVFPGTTVSTPALYSLCEGSSVVLRASGEGIYKWTPSQGLSNDTIPNPVAKPSDSTTYKLVITNRYGCKDSALVTINVFRNPEVSAGPDKTIVKGDTVLLNGYVKGTAVNFTWSPAVYMQDPTLVSPRVFPAENTQYTLQATSTVGCGTLISTVRVYVYKDIYLPSAFTPNGDGKNDAFHLFAADGYKLNKFVIYNRYGAQLFKARNATDSWDGTFKNIPQPQGSYIYLLQLETATGKVINKKGTITLVR